MCDLGQLAKRKPARLHLQVQFLSSFGNSRSDLTVSGGDDDNRHSNDTAAAFISTACQSEQRSGDTLY